MSEQVPSQSTSSSACSSWSFDWRLHQSFYRTEEPVLFDRDGDTTIVTTTSPGVNTQRMFRIQSRHLYLNSSFYKRLFSDRCIRNIPRTDDHLRLFKITLSDVDTEALFLILCACHSGHMTIPASNVNFLDFVLRIAKTAHDLEFNIGMADPASNTAPLSQFARAWLLDRNPRIIVGNNVDRWKLVKAAFYFSQRHAFWQLSVDLTKRLRDPFWAHLAGDIRRGLNLHVENVLTSEEETIIAIRLLFLFYKVLYREAPFPPYRIIPLPVSQLPARVTENLSDATKAMWDAQVREESSQACTCSWLPAYFDTWKRVMELHLDIPLFPEGVTESRSRRVLGWILLRLSRDEVFKPWDSCLPGQEPACSLANGRVGHEEKARELVRRLRRCLWAWSADGDRDPVEDSEPDSDPVEQNDVMGYTGVQHNEVEGPDAQYPNPVYRLPHGNPNIDMPEDEQTRNRDPEDFVILQPSYPEDADQGVQ
ncbi:hypothetical protein QBC45DRAFT_374000 [Copromyces sp. CBS 386.78]|nr:hypothetical protein QBC45DRAFT_374000 [Copromyces sp. CBS 386.78]